jgi:hypothetical protein
MHRQGHNLQLTQYDERGWRATFYTTGMEHSTTSATAPRGVRTSWRATQRAAWEALKKKPESESGQEEREWKKMRSYTHCWSVPRS